jgi:histone H3/H4
MARIKMTATTRPRVGGKTIPGIALKKPATAHEVEKEKAKHRRHHPNALRQIVKWANVKCNDMRSVDNNVSKGLRSTKTRERGIVMSRTPFLRATRDILAECTTEPMRVTSEFVENAMCEVENIAHEIFLKAGFFSRHASRTTLCSSDLSLAIMTTNLKEARVVISPANFPYRSGLDARVLKVHEKMSRDRLRRAAKSAPLAPASSQ